jgi:hypothetical protein
MDGICSCIDDFTVTRRKLMTKRASVTVVEHHMKKTPMNMREIGAKMASIMLHILNENNTRK